VCGKYLVRHLEVGGRVARGGRRRREKGAGVGRRCGEDTGEMRGPLDREAAGSGWMGRPRWFRPTGMARPMGGLGHRPSGPQGWPGRKQGKRISDLKLDF
jgi:hypothetical protein